MIPFGRRPKMLPAVLSGEEVNRLLSCVTSLKRHTFLLVQYAAGLRLNEAARLTIPDIDSARMQLRIVSGKGQKTRVVPMSPRLLAALREYWKTVKSPHYCSVTAKKSDWQNDEKRGNCMAQGGASCVSYTSFD